MILQWFYKETMISYDFRVPPRTYKDPLRIIMIFYDFAMILQ